MVARRRIRITQRVQVKVTPRLTCTGCRYTASPSSFRSSASPTGGRCPRCRRTLV